MMLADNSTAHFIFGPTAAGKSTYARALATKTNGVRFAIDEWMHTLFSADVSDQMDLAWALARVSRCQKQIRSTATQILGTGTDVVLELGLLRIKDREAARTFFETAGFQVQLHFVDAELSIRKKRVLERNTEKGETYSFDVTPEMFEAMESYFQRPSPDELARSIQIA